MRPDFDLIAIDLDGTLLSSKGEISSENLAVVAACARAGVAIAIVTGRRFPSARPFAKALSVGAMVVANSGAIIKESADGPVVRRRLLNRETAELVLDRALLSGHEPVLHEGADAEGHLTMRRAASSHPHLARYLHQTVPPPSLVSSLRIAQDPVQVGFASSVNGVRALASSLRQDLKARGLKANLIRTEYPREDLALLDVLDAEASKASALSFLARRRKVPLSRTLAIGDNWNDEDMLETAGLGVVMANASPELLAKGFAQTDSNDDNGVARALTRYVLRGTAPKK